jgi:hypothetical protein
MHHVHAEVVRREGDPAIDGNRLASALQKQAIHANLAEATKRYDAQGSS